MTCCVNYHLNIIWKATEKSKVCHFLFLVFGKVSSIRNERGFLSRTLGEKNAKERSLQTKQSRFRLCELSFRRSVTSLGAKSLSVCLSVRDRIIMSYLFPWQRLDFFFKSTSAARASCTSWIRKTASQMMDEKLIIKSHPECGYYYDIQYHKGLVSNIPNLGVLRRSVFDEVRTPAYK